MKKIIFLFVIAAGAITLTLNSCKKEKPDTETQSAVDNNLCETEFTKAMSTINAYAIKEQGVKSMMDGSRSSCPSITISPADTLDGFPITMILDYGTTGCYDSIDHKTRKGQVVCVFSNFWHLIGSSIKVNMNNFSVDGTSYTVDSIKLIHSAPHAFTNQVFNGTSSNAAYSIQWACNRTLSQTDGYTTLFNIYDDVFSLTGTANGVNRKGLAYTVNITTPLIKRNSCSWIESGRMDLTPDGFSVRTVDFGNGSCDSQATVTINGNTFTFTMN